MELEDDNPILRAQVFNERFGEVPASTFRRNLDDAINHAIAATADAPARNWVPMGPRNIGGRISCIAQDPINPDILYAGSAFGGVWKTTDWGDTWLPMDFFSRGVAAPQPAAHLALPIGAIAVARSDHQYVYVGTGEPQIQKDRSDYDVPGFGLFRSIDGGATFQHLDSVDNEPGRLSVMRATRFEKIVVDPWERERCWIACPTGLYMRSPAGVISQVVVGSTAPVAAQQTATDVVIDFGDVTGAQPATYTVYVGLHSNGIFRGTFTVATQAYSAWTKLHNGIVERQTFRVKLALCASQPNILYCVFALDDSAASNVYRTDNRGDQWRKTRDRPDDDGKQAHYDLVLEVHPRRPDLVFTGSVELWRTQNSGERWEKVLTWTRYDQGDRAQHADQHAFLLDRSRDGTVWLCNDGGISRSRNLGKTWRKKSYNILAVQFYDITVHPDFPWATIGGFQDNGSWVGLGGPTWFHLSGGDGGACVFEPGHLHHFIVTWQGWQGNGSRHQRGVVRCDVSNLDENPGVLSSADYKSALPDLTTARPGDDYKIKKFRSNNSDLTKGFDSANTAVFTGVMEHHPSLANHFLVGRKGAVYVTLDGDRFLKQSTGDFIGGFDAAVSAVAYSPSAPNTDRWITTNRGQVFRESMVGANLTWTDVTPPALKADLNAAIAASPPAYPPNYPTDVAVHPTDPNIVAVTVMRFPGGRVYLTGDAGVTWIEISGRIGPPNGIASAAPNQTLNPSAMCVAFDPQSGPVAGAQTIYVGTLAGVYVIRNIIPPTAAAPVPANAPIWLSFNANFPLTLVYDIAPVEVKDAANTVVRRALRIGTHGRGLYECDLAGAPPVQLFIRNTPISDGRFYQGAAALASDPRQVVMDGDDVVKDNGVPRAVPLRFDKGFDVRVGVPPFGEFEGSIDGVEFDEMLINAVPTAGLKNLVFVQVHTNGHADQVGNVLVQLYFADAPGDPPVIPDLQADFWTAFPADPPPGAWRKGASETIAGLGPAQPVVARLEWIPPLDAGTQVALLAVATRPPAGGGADPLADDLKAAAPTLVMNPANAASLVRTERRAAVRVTALDTSLPSVFIRDAANDAGPSGSVAWGGRSPDIIVRPDPEIFPEAIFADLGDSRPDDFIFGNKDNQIFVRVSNRMDLELSADVELFTAPRDTLAQPATWVRLGARVTVAAIPPKGWKLTPAFSLNNPPDPAPGDGAYKVVVLVAIVTRTGQASPVRDFITDLKKLWDFIIAGRDTSANATPDVSAAVRALRWKPAP